MAVSLGEYPPYVKHMHANNDAMFSNEYAVSENNAKNINIA